MFLLGLGPILWMIVALCGLKMAGHKASFVAMVLAAVLAITVWKLPLLDTASAALEGFAMAAWPIILVIIAAVFLYNLSLHTGKMEVIKQMITSVSGDKRLLGPPAPCASRQPSAYRRWPASVWGGVGENF